MIRVQQHDFDVGEELSKLTDGNTTIGGVCTFVGLVRDFSGTGTGAVESLTLEHYPGMTEKELKGLEKQAQERWPLEAMLVVHRFGRLQLGERIVLVAVASAHRKAAFEACHFLIDELKIRAPFWKKETGPSGGSWVEVVK